MEKKLSNLKKNISGMESALIAYSGGVDSTFLLKIASEILKNNLIAVIARSIIYSSTEYDKAVSIAQDLNVRLLTIPIEVFSNPKFTENSNERCYWCKKDIFSRFISIAKEHDLNYVIDGSNCDDVSDFRPGMKAAQELGIRSPLMEAELNKSEIRKLSHSYNLPTWNKPSLACFASRFPYGTIITEQDVIRISKAEEFLHSLGIQQLRVRHHNDTARIEVTETDISVLIQENKRNKIVKRFKELGYTYITIDLPGRRCPSAI